MGFLPTLAVRTNLGNPEGRTHRGPDRLLAACRAAGLPLGGVVHLVPAVFRGGRSTEGEFYRRLYRAVQSLLPTGYRPDTPALFLGGDHAMAMATWSAVMDAMDDPAHFGLLWIDAHLDAHTFSTSPSGHSHGMPVAALLGARERRLRHLYPGHNHLAPENLRILGVRSYEREEAAFLRRMGVRWTPATAMASARDCHGALTRAVQALSHCRALGLSIDLDALSLNDAPDVATPVMGGIRLEHLAASLSALGAMNLPWVALEIAEYSPRPGAGTATAASAVRLIECFTGGRATRKGPRGHRVAESDPPPVPARTVATNRRPAAKY